MRPRTGAGFAAFVLALAAAGCGTSAPRARRPTSTSRTTVAPTSTRASTTSTTTAATTTTSATTTAPSRASTATTFAPTTTTIAAPTLVTRIAGLGAAQQVITVVAPAPGSSTASVSAYERGANGWSRVFGPWFSYIGRSGVAPVGAKREGDGRTPSGVFGFDFAFGTGADPGTRYPFRMITGQNIVWDDDPASPRYNEWVDTTTSSAGASPEPMDVAPYRDGIVIAYNDARTPGLGSGIFLHVTHSSPTSGCITLTQSELLEILRWLDPSQSPRIAIGTPASLTS